MLRNTQYATRNTPHASRLTPYALASPALPVFWLAIALMLGLFYLVVAAWGYGAGGFPLDDAWIHQTYARNLANSGQLAFVPGVPSAGSTAPLWTLMLSVGHLPGISYKLWTYGLGIVCLGLTGWTVKRLAGLLFPKQQNVGLWAGLFCVFEWHLVWAAVSGMETILFVWLSVLLVERYLAGQFPQSAKNGGWRFFWLGMTGGLLMLTRPEGAGLVGLIGLDMAFRWWRGGERKTGTLLRRWLGIVVGAGLLLVPYIAFHLYLTGRPFPNTLYAKQAEYGLILENFPLWWRLFGNVGPPVESVQGVFRVIFIGPQILLLPGLVYAGWLTFKERRTELWLTWAWWISYLLLYGLRLPVTYQHGRYQIPAIVWVVLLGVWGTAKMASRRPGQSAIRRVLGRALVASLVVLLLFFTVIGAQAFARDARIIDSEMVATANWLQDNTAPAALIAAHDIGAIGYFAPRPLIDLAGLVTPEVIPIIRDETALLEFMRENQAEYLVTFPSWYPEITQSPGLVEIYTTHSPWAPPAGGDNMTVYQLANPAER